MPNGVKFPGQVLSVWLEKEDDRERLVRILDRKYKNQLGFSSYAKLAIYRQLDEDEDEATATAKGNQNDEGGQSAGLPGTTRRAEDVQDVVVVKSGDDAQTIAEEGDVCNE